MSLLDFIFPKTCLGCHRWGAYLCSDCLNHIHPIHTPICPRCHKASILGLTHQKCSTPLSLDGLTSFFPYHGIIKQAITKHKFKLVSQLTQELIDLAISYGDFTALSSRNWLVVPVPLHPRRLRWRGFNQAHELASRLAQYLNQPYQPDLLNRIRYTQPQSSLKGNQRRHNLRNAFQLSLQTTSTPHPAILLVDDVYTTGSTLKEAAKTLKRAGYPRVWGLTIARTL